MNETSCLGRSTERKAKLLGWIVFPSGESGDAELDDDVGGGFLSQSLVANGKGREAVIRWRIGIGHMQTGQFRIERQEVGVAHSVPHVRQRRCEVLGSNVHFFFFLGYCAIRSIAFPTP